MAERLADKYEEAKEKQEDIMNRWVQALLCFITDCLLLSRGLTEQGGQKVLSWNPGFLQFSLLGHSGDLSIQLQPQAEQACGLEMLCESSWKGKVKSWAPETQEEQQQHKAGGVLAVSSFSDVSCFVHQGWRKYFGVSTLSFLFCQTVKKIWGKSCRQYMTSCSTWAMPSDRWEHMCYCTHLTHTLW